MRSMAPNAEERAMSQSEDRDYFLFRARRERVIADIARDGMIAGLHLRLAEEYERRAAACALPVRGRLTLV